MDCVVINLDKDVERWEKLHAELTRVGIVHHRFSAINGRELGSEYDHLMKMGTRAFTPKGVLGSALSHHLVLAEFLKGELETCLVLEDDALLDDQVTEHLKLVMSSAPPGWDMIKLASSPNKYNGPNVLQKCAVSLDYVARLVSREGARKLLAERISWPGYADVTFWTVPDFNSYIVNKKYRTFYQTWDDSSISGTRYPNWYMNIKVVKTGPFEWVVGDLLMLLVLVAALKVLRQTKSKSLHPNNR
jgi:GR25 family glycosyltransferase involved in LPS biosynthesis